MRWTRKARLQRLFASMPVGGDRVYRTVQKRCGALSGDPFSRLAHQAELLRGVLDLRGSVHGARCMEVGTGHIPIAPIGWYLSGAAETVTVDLHRRVDIGLVSEAIRRMKAEPDRVVSLYNGLVQDRDVRRRLTALIGEGDPLPSLRALGVRYRAPCDATQMSEPDDSFDIHFSVTTLEHIPPDVLCSVLSEGHRLLRSDGIAVHLIDPSDHFSHSDPSILPINFLRFTDYEWRKIADNEFSYCNRLRASQFCEAFESARFTVARSTPTISEDSVTALKNHRFAPAARFDGMTAEDLCTTRIDVYAMPSTRDT